MKVRDGTLAMPSSCRSREEIFSPVAALLFSPTSPWARRMSRNASSIRLEPFLLVKSSGPDHTHAAFLLVLQWLTAQAFSSCQL